MRGERTAWESSECVGVLMYEDVLAYMRCKIVHVNEAFVLIICTTQRGELVSDHHYSNWISESV